ncbi:membrane protein [Aquaticitalea lipolytica]|jgi:putative membrane protein|uniref:Membrane protein n=1 Tax=Aquaticitalea lipolytica TaxID=1247562 RepID=A0A8J2TSN1_9FLAO|nr:phage holin family protein [Aquaticitalea lipolytica]GFZ94013.1 membrane protein [Aquaticitalea lipolytica]
MNLIIRLLLTAVAVIVLSKILPGVQVVDFTSAIIIAVVLAILNAVLKPILVILTFPITVVTLGLFLLAINAGIIMLADYLLDGFAVSGFWIALLFSLLLSLMQSVLYSLLDKDIKQS